MRQATIDALQRERAREKELVRRIDRAWRCGNGVRIRADDVQALRRLVVRGL